MKHIYILLILGSIFSSNQNSHAQVMSDVYNLGITKSTNTIAQPQALWDILFNYNILAITGRNGVAGVCVLNNEIWVSRWQTDSLFKISMNGTLLASLKIPGSAGARSLTTDGTYIYEGVYTNKIQKIDPVSKTVVGSITVPIAKIRSLSYDASADNGNGGFWASDWGTEINLFSKDGTNTLNTIYTSDHKLTGMYGTACDNFSSGGPYLWISDQNFDGTGKTSEIVQLKIATGKQTGIIHNTMSDVGIGGSDTSGIAGGLFISLQGSTVNLVGVLQGLPTNRLFSYDLGLATEISENKPNEITTNVFPNPVNDMINIKTNFENNEASNLQITDVTGKIVYQTTSVFLNNYFNVSNYKSGVYFVKIISKEGIFNTKFIKK